MKYFLTYLITIFIFLNAYSQFTDNYSFYTLHNLKPDSCKSEAIFSYGNFISSNSITSKFVNSMYQKKYISDYLKRQNKIKSVNYFASEDNANISYAHIFDSLAGFEKTGIKVAFENSYHADAAFSRDIYNLAFFGNKDYAGKTIDFSGSQFQFIQSQQLKLGVFKQVTSEEGPFTVYLGVGIIKGQNFNYLTVDTGKIFTSETGESIAFTTDAKYFSSDTARKKWQHFNGVGACADLAFIFEDKSSNYHITCALTDIGFIRWNTNALYVPVDTSVFFDGISIDSILWGKDTSFASGISEDSILNAFYKHSKKTSFTKVLPEKVNLSITKYFFNKKLFSTFGISYMYHASCPFPLVYLKNEYIFKNKIGVIAQIAGGGYGNYQFGLGFNARFSKYFAIQLMSNNIISPIIPEKTLSQHYAARIILNF